MRKSKIGAKIVGTKEQIIDDVNRDVRDYLTVNTKPYREKSVCECGIRYGIQPDGSVIHLQACHIKGQDRPYMIGYTLDKFYKPTKEIYTVQDRNILINYILDEHEPFEEHFIYQCPVCHKKYDKEDSSEIELKSITVGTLAINTPKTIIKPKTKSKESPAYLGTEYEIWCDELKMSFPSYDEAAKYIKQLDGGIVLTSSILKSIHSAISERFNENHFAYKRHWYKQKKQKIFN
jgi:hypothetical protein